MNKQTPALTCQEVVELMTDHLDGALSASDLIRFHKHLDQCEGCANYLDQMSVTIRSLGRLTVEQIPEPMMQRLLGAFRNWGQP